MQPVEIPAIKFGTDGWRGIIADDFTFDNVALVGSAIRQYLLDTSYGDRPLLVGYDRRFAAEAYAAHLATHLASLGQPTVMHDSSCPTPVTAFGVQHLHGSGAVMLTASHNPHYYQGLKFIPWFAGPAMPETTDRITQLIQEIAPHFLAPKLVTEWRGEKVNLKEPYFQQLDSIVNANAFVSSRQKILYAAMHGVGAGYLDGYLKRVGVEVKTVQAARDVYFGGTLPDPSPANLLPLMAQSLPGQYDLLIGTDGDADRFGIVLPGDQYFGANSALPLLADYLVRFRQQRGRLIRTVSTSHLLDAIAKEHMLDLVETPVGFKFVGDELRKGGLIGGEESGGISIQGHIPEKDGILSSLLILELAATTGESIADLYRGLQKRYGPLSYVRVDQEIEDAEKQRLLQALRDYGKPSFAGHKIASRDALDGTRFVFDTGSWMLVRASGTEPLIRVYIESTKADKLDKLKAQVLAEIKTLAHA